jgi:hypothetical protein
MAAVTHLGLLPFCFSFSAANGGYGSSSLGTSSPYPIGLDVKTLLRWYWRIKRWTVSATLTGTGIRGTPISTSEEFTFFNGNYESPELTTEKQLVCRRSVFYQGGSEPGEAAPFGILMFNEGVQKVDELYYPSLSLGYTNGAGFIGTSQVEPGSTSGGTIIMDGLTLPSWLFGQFAPITSGSITITPDEYWPYDPGDGGGPIYDSATGAQLRSFP